MSTGTTKLMRIGAVCNELRAEFPDVSISKLRFLEEQGLVQPQRTPGGYRMYADRDVEALRQILRMQRDEFLPLKVIREELQRRLAVGSSAGAAMSRPGTPAAGAGRSPGAKISLTAPDDLISLELLVQRAQVAADFVEECRQHDLVEGQRTPDGGISFTLQECGIVQAAAQMQRLGIDLRHLRQVRSAVGRQAALVEQYAAARLRTPNVEQRETAVRNVEALTQSLADFMRLAFVRDVRLMTSRTLGSAAHGAQPPGRQEPAGLR